MKRDRGGRGGVSSLDPGPHGSPVGRLAHQLTAPLPDPLAAKLMTTAGTDRLAALHTAIELVRRGGTISLSGVYGGTADPMPLLTMFDKQIQLRMGQANVHRWIPDILPLLIERTLSGPRISPPTGYRSKPVRRRIKRSRTKKTA